MVVVVVVVAVDDNPDSQEVGLVKSLVGKV